MTYYIIIEERQTDKLPVLTHLLTLDSEPVKCK